mgnify:CR=1 FL=1
MYQVVTTMRQDALHGLISKESPLGKALLGRKVGETFHIQVNDTYGYDAVVKAIEKGADDGSVPLNRFEPMKCPARMAPARDIFVIPPAFAAR